jgi:uncharacterized membrane protein
MPTSRSRWFELLRWATVLLILKVTASILANYPSYFPPDFTSLFLEGREHTFWGIYSVGFYVHIFAAPFVLLSGTVLLLERRLKPDRTFHRWLGRVHVVAILLLLVPSSLVMATRSFGGWPAGLSFGVLSIVTGFCAVMGVRLARQRRFAEHRRWMLRCYVLLCSAVTLRLISGAASMFEVEDAVSAYRIASWTSWVVPLVVFEVWQRRKAKGGT